STFAAWYATIFSCLSLLNLFFFFFSSRRRHTRSKRDWSSDVCSSDLGALCRAGARAPAGSPGRSVREASRVRRSHPVGVAAVPRSEERRVGKECRSRGGGGQ